MQYNTVNSSPHSSAVAPVTDYDTFVAALRLRYRVYRSLGYIADGDGFDVDDFDQSSLHFVVTSRTGDVTGTVRLILAGHVQCDHARSELEAITQWCHRLRPNRTALDAGSAALPVFQTMNINRIPTGRGTGHLTGELSRIIVAPDCRSQGIARRLALAVLDKARELDLSELYLECLPQHAALFARFGFEVTHSALEYSHLSVPNRVVAMKLPLTGRPAPASAVSPVPQHRVLPAS